MQANNSKAMSTNELIELLKARDHNGEYRNLSGQGNEFLISSSIYCSKLKVFHLFLVFSEQELDALMDRSDLIDGSTPKGEIKEISGVFKRLDVVTDEMKKT